MNLHRIESLHVHTSACTDLYYKQDIGEDIGVICTTEFIVSERPLAGRARAAPAQRLRQLSITMQQTKARCQENTSQLHPS